MLNPPVGKSGVNHRFRRIEEIVDNFKKERGANIEIKKVVVRNEVGLHARPASLLFKLLINI